MDNWLFLLAEEPQRVGARVTVSIFFGLVAFGGGIVYVLLKTNMLRARDRIYSALSSGSLFFCIGILFFSAAVSYLTGHEPYIPFIGSPNANPRVAEQRPSRPVLESRSAPAPQPSLPALETQRIYKPVTRETPDEKTMQAANAIWRADAPESGMALPIENAPAANSPIEQPSTENSPAENPPVESPSSNVAMQMRAQAEREAAIRERMRVAKEPEEKTGRNNEDARMVAVELPEPPQALSRFSYVGTAVQESSLLGRARGLQFTDRAPDGGVMVGAICFIGDNWGKSIAGIQPIYQVEDKYVKGGVCGNETDRPLLTLAEPGGAVAGVNVRLGLIMDAVQLVYAPIKGGKVNSQQAYVGEHAGSNGGSPHSFDSDGKMIAGIFGTYEKDKSLICLGMYVIPRIRVTDSPAPSQQNELRTFTSSDGKFTVKAKLLKVNEDGTLSLEKEDGSKISAPIKSLSSEDQAYIRANQ